MSAHRRDSAFDFQAAEAALPGPIREQVQMARWHAEALGRGGEASPPPDRETAAQRFVRGLREAGAAEAEHAARVNKALHENPTVRPDAPPDPVQALYRQAQARAPRGRRRGRVPR